jgi:hypothetical protein
MEVLWKRLFTEHFLNSSELLKLESQNLVWKKEFIKYWKEQQANCWIEITKEQNKLTNKNKTFIHGKGTYYHPMRAKHGILVA